MMHSDNNKILKEKRKNINKLLKKKKSKIMNLFTGLKNGYMFHQWSHIKQMEIKFLTNLK